MAHYFDFKPPKPYSVVNWCHLPGEPTCPAFVTAVFDRTISCTVFPLDYTFGQTKDGVRHVADPESPHLDPEAGGGYWDFTEDQKMLHDAVGDPVDKVKMMK